MPAGSAAPRALKLKKRLIGPPITAVVTAGPPSGLDLRGLLPGVGAVRRRCPETGGERAAQPEYASALGIGGKGRAVLEAPSGPHQVQRITVASGAVTARKDDATATDQAATVKLEVSVFSPFDGGFIQTTSC